MIDSVIEFNKQSMIQSLKFVEANNVNKNIFEIINYQKAIRYQGYINICDWFADSKLSYQTEHEKTKSILFARKHKTKFDNKSNIVYNNIDINQYPAFFDKQSRHSPKPKSTLLIQE